MSMFTLAISSLTTSNLPWFMDLAFQFPMQCCFLQHQTLVPSPAPYSAGHCFPFGSVSSFFFELFLHSSPVGYRGPSNLGSSSLSVISFFFLILFMGFSRQVKWSSLPFPSPVDYILSKLSTMTHPSWMSLHVVAHDFIELDKTVVHVISLISFLWWLFSFCLHADG